MRVAIDGRSIVRSDIGRVSGINQFTSQIIAALPLVAPADQFIIFGEDDSPLRSIPFVGQHIILPAAIHRQKIDLYFSPTGLLPLGLNVPAVIFVHDLFILDHPEWFPDSALQQAFTLRLVLPRSINRARAIVVPSELVKRDVINAFPQARPKLRVVPEGVTRYQPSPAPVIDGRYVVSVATIEPRKNLLFALQVFEAVLSREPSLARTLRYVIAGSRGWGYEPVATAIEDLNSRWRQYRPDGVARYLGAVSDEERHSLYEHAELYLCTSYAEGFGLPPLEAMAVGTAVVTTPVGVIPELAKGAVARLAFNDVDQAAETIWRLLKSDGERAALASKGREAVSPLTWERAAEQLLAIFRSVKS